MSFIHHLQAVLSFNQRAKLKPHMAGKASRAASGNQEAPAFVQHPANNQRGQGPWAEPKRLAELQVVARQTPRCFSGKKAAHLYMIRPHCGCSPSDTASTLSELCCVLSIAREGLCKRKGVSLGRGAINCISQEN